MVIHNKWLICVGDFSGRNQWKCTRKFRTVSNRYSLFWTFSHFIDLVSDFHKAILHVRTDVSKDTFLYARMHKWMRRQIIPYSSNFNNYFSFLFHKSLFGLWYQNRDQIILIIQNFTEKNLLLIPKNKNSVCAPSCFPVDICILCSIINLLILMFQFERDLRLNHFYGICTSSVCPILCVCVFFFV